MSKAEKQLEKLKNSTDMEWKTIEAILKKYGFTLCNSNGGSHFTYIQPTLAKIAEIYMSPNGYKKYGPDGRIVVIVHHGHVYKECLLRISDAINDINDFEKSL